jgi:hypothetical protein
MPSVVCVTYWWVGVNKVDADFWVTDSTKPNKSVPTQYLLDFKFFHWNIILFIKVQFTFNPGYCEACFVVCMHFASERSKHAKLTEGEPVIASFKKENTRRRFVPGVSNLNRHVTVPATPSRSYQPCIAAKSGNLPENVPFIAAKASLLPSIRSLDASRPWY